MRCLNLSSKFRRLTEPQRQHERLSANLHGLVGPVLSGTYTLYRAFCPSSICRPHHSPVVKSTMALMQLYSAESTCRALSFSTCSWKMRMWSMKATTRSADMGDACRPAAASNGATCSGMEHCAAFSTNNSLHVSLRSDTWSVIWRSGKKGMFRAHSTALKRRRAANSQMFSIPMILLGCMHWLPYRDVG